jgi:hypothetical protein
MPQAVSPTSANLKTLPRYLYRLTDAVFVGWALMAVVRLFRAGEANGEDFRVYYRSAHALAHHLNPYAFSAADQGFVFKYLPWFLPVFSPLRWLAWENARLAWYLVELGSLAYALLWIFSRMATRKIPWRLTAACTAAYWWLWHAHFSAGQFAALILAACAWSQWRPTPFRLGALNFFLTAKIFSVFTALGEVSLLRQSPRRTRTLVWVAGWTIGILAVAHGLAAWLSPVPVAELYRGWALAALSGGTQLKEEAIRGQGNNGLTVFFMRLFHVPASHSSIDVAAALGLGALLALAWHRLARGLADHERWAGWMALGVIVHPLAWHHSFVVVQPLSTFAVARAYRAGNGRLLALAIVGLACVALFVPQVIGTSLARYAELGSLKAWGTLISAGALAAAARQSPAETEHG